MGEIFPVGKNSEDIMYTTRAFCKVTKAVYVDECLYNYVLDREGSIMNVNRTERMFQDEIPFWREHIAYIRQHVSDEMGDMAAYYFYRRMLSYYMELSQQAETRNAAKQIASMMKNEKAVILKVYGNAYEGKGDVVRMNIFMMSPTAYKIMNKLYEKVIIPLRKK